MDSAEFRALYQRTAPSLRGYLRRCVGSIELADDLVQDTFLRFLRAAPREVGEPQIRGYLFRTADSILADHWRRKARQRRRDERLEQEAAAQEAARRDEREISPGVEGGYADPSGDGVGMSDRMTKAMQRLKPKSRRLLWLAYVEALSHREIAEILALRESSIRVLLFRARRALERELRKER